MEPGGQRLASGNGPGFANEHQEGRLERILDGRFLSENPSADVQHQPGVAPDQQLERRLVSALDESSKQFAIAEAGCLDGPEQTPKGAKNPVSVVISHASGILQARGYL
jgi:hypothetical protein